MSAGLQTQIWNNNLKSAFLLISYPFLLLAMLGVFCAMLALSRMQMDMAAGADSAWNAAWQGIITYGPVLFAVTLAWFGVSFLFHQAMINAATGARAISRSDAAEIYNLLENLCISRGMAMPKLYIIDSEALNAYASGLSDTSYAVTLTRGIVNALDKNELEGVIAHELSHIRHRDVRMMVICVIFVGMISFLCQTLGRSLRFGAMRSGGNRRGGNGAAMLIAMVVLGIGYLFSVLIRLAISRSREYLADAGAVELTKNPDALASALRKISGHADLPGAPDDVKQMCIENRSDIFGLFATHPPIEKRIAVLENMGSGHYAAGAALGGKEAAGPASPRGPWG